MIRKALLVMAVLGAAAFASSSSVAEAGGCYRGGGYGGYGFYRGGGYAVPYRAARFYGPRYGYGYHPRAAYFAGPPRYYRGGSGVFFSVGF